MSEAPDPTAHVHTSGANAFTRKIGPLPVWGYALIIIGAAVAYRVYQSRKAAASGGLASTATSTPAPATDPTGSGQGSAGSVGYSVPTDGPNGTPGSQTNAQWSLTVSNGLVAAGSDPGAVSRAINDYLNGNALDPAETAIISVAVTKYGFPPEGVLPVKQPTITNPPPNNSSNSKVVHSYRIMPGDTLQSIAAHFYGSNAGSYQAYVVSQNQGVFDSKGHVLPGHMGETIHITTGHDNSPQVVTR